MIRTLIVADRNLLVKSLKSTLEQDDQITVIGCVGDGLAAVKLCNTLLPDLVLIQYDYTLNGKLKLETEVVNLETKYQWELSRGFKMAAIAGYSDGSNTVKLNGKYTYVETVDGALDDSDTIKISGKLEQDIHAPYIGGQISYAPLATLELGVAGRYLIDPSHKVKVSYNGRQRSELEDIIADGDFDSWKVDLFGIATLSEKWSLKVNYSINYTCYELTHSVASSKDAGSLKLENTTRQLTAALRYKF
jgi:hypothetical protein